MKYTLLLAFLIVFLPFFVIAQDTSDIPELETDRPNFTQGATVVPQKTIQIETGFEYRKDLKMNDLERDFDYPTTLIRIGLLKKAELRIDFDYEEEQHRNIDGSTMLPDRVKVKGFKNVRIGTKIALLEGQGAMPAIAVLGNVTLPVGNKEFRPPHAAPEGRLLFNNQLSEKLELQYNIGYRKRMDDEYRAELLYSVAPTLDLTDNLKTFIEFQSLKPVQQSVENSLDAGFMYKIIQNLQLDLYVGAGLSEAAPDFYTGAGLTWRIPR